MSTFTVWYDGNYPLSRRETLCRREIALMQRLDRPSAIAFIDASERGSANYPADRAQLLARFHPMEHGKLRSGAAAFAGMWRAARSRRPLGLAARVPPVLAVLQRGYRLFLQLCPGLQRAAGIESA